jgi:hypothetical protein
VAGSVATVTTEIARIPAHQERRLIRFHVPNNIDGARPNSIIDVRKLVATFNALQMNKKYEKERLRRVMAVVLESAKDAEAVSSTQQQDRRNPLYSMKTAFCPGDFVALLFHEGETIRYWIANVVRMMNRSSNRKTIWRSAVNIDDEIPETLWLKVSFLEPQCTENAVELSETNYTFMNPSENFHEVQAIHVVGCPRMDYNELSNSFQIQLEDLEHLNGEVDKANEALQKALHLKPRKRSSVITPIDNGVAEERLKGKTSKFGRSTTRLNLY